MYVWFPFTLNVGMQHKTKSKISRTNFSTPNGHDFPKFHFVQNSNTYENIIISPTYHIQGKYTTMFDWLGEKFFNIILCANERKDVWIVSVCYQEEKRWSWNYVKMSTSVDSRRHRISGVGGNKKTNTGLVM